MGSDAWGIGPRSIDRSHRTVPHPERQAAILAAVHSKLLGVPEQRPAQRRLFVFPPRPPLVVLTAAVALAAWLLIDPRTPDLSAQVYRVDLFKSAGFTLFDTRWYAGHHLPGYSLLFPALASLIGIRLLALLCVLASSALFEQITFGIYGCRARAASMWFALAATGDVWVGRLTFALGVTLALAAVLGLLRGHRVMAVFSALLCAAASPVCGLLLVMAALTRTIKRRSVGQEVLLVAPCLVLTVTVALLFPEGGYEPFPVLSFAACAAVTIGFLLVLPKEASLLRVGGLLYLLACVLSLLIHTPMGSNVERYGVLLAGPLLICASGRRALAPQVALVLCGVAIWVIWGPVRETAAIAHSPSTNASYYIPVRSFIRAHGGQLVRVEVPLTRSHWEAALLAPYVSLARGWEKQLDERYNRVLLSKTLTSASYHRWIRQQAVSYVALPDTQLDPSSAREGALVRAGLPYLRLVFRSRHWRVYRVIDPTPLVAGPGTLRSLGSDDFTVRAHGPGRLVVRIHYTRYWTITQGSGCLSQAPGGWTALTVRSAELLKVSARFSLSGALGLEKSCS